MDAQDRGDLVSARQPVYVALFGDVTVTSIDGLSFVATRASAPKVTGVGETAEEAIVDLLANEKRRAS